MKHSPYNIFLLIFFAVASSFSRGRGINSPGSMQHQSRDDETSDTSDTQSSADLNNQTGAFSLITALTVTP